MFMVGNCLDLAVYSIMFISCTNHSDKLFSVGADTSLLFDGLSIPVLYSNENLSLSLELEVVENSRPSVQIDFDVLVEYSKEGKLWTHA